MNSFDSVLGGVKVFLNASLGDENASFLCLLAVKCTHPILQSGLKVWHSGDELGDDTFRIRSFPAIVTEQGHCIVYLLESLEHAYKILSFAATSVYAGDEPFKVWHLGHLRGESITDCSVRIK